MGTRINLEFLYNVGMQKAIPTITQKPEAIKDSIYKSN